MRMTDLSDCLTDHAVPMRHALDTTPAVQCNTETITRMIAPRTREASR
jgi:hypothetical protein